MTKRFLVLSRKRMRFYAVLAVLGLSLIFPVVQLILRKITGIPLMAHLPIPVQ
jgi:hypothetical protein